MIKTFFNQVKFSISVHILCIIFFLTIFILGEFSSVKQFSIIGIFGYPTFVILYLIKWSIQTIRNNSLLHHSQR